MNNTFYIGATLIDPLETVIHHDERALQLTHYVMAERCMQVEYHNIMKEHGCDGHSETLTHILSGGMKGWHDIEPEKLIHDYKEIENQFYNIYDDEELPWYLYEEDPLNKLERGELAT